MTEQEQVKSENHLKKLCFTVVDKVLQGCPRDFDGYYCWAPTSPGTLAVQNCTNKYVIAEIEGDGVVTRQCTSNGTWFTNGGTHAWTNFSQCGTQLHYVVLPDDMEEALILFEKFEWFLRYVTVLGYSLSIVSLLAAMAIFICLKRLHCERNKLHLNLFISYLIKAVIHLSKMGFFEGDALVTNITWQCKLFVTLNWYFVLANFTFLLMEGLYLRNLIFLNLFSESHGTTIYCIVGWVMPAFFIVVWLIVKILIDDTLCWTQISNLLINYLIEVPTIATVLANLVLFVIIMRVLIMKIHFTSTFMQSKKVKYRQLIRSTLILIPLYGIPYTFSTILLILSRTIFTKGTLFAVYLFFDQSTSSFQGLFAALAYCLLNSDVRYELVRKYTTLIDQTHKEFRRSRTISSNTQQFSLQNTEDGLENLKLFGILDDEGSIKIKATNGHSR